MSSPLAILKAGVALLLDQTTLNDPVSGNGVNVVQSQSVPGTYGVVVLNPDGTGIAGGTGGSAGQQYTQGVAAPASPIGTAMVWNNAGTWEAVGSANPLPITGSFSSGPLATAAKGTTTTGSPTSENTDANTQSLHTKIVNASIPVTGTFWQATQPISSTDGALASIGTTTDASTLSTVIGRLKAILNALGGGLPAALGQTTMAASLPVVLANNQSSIPVTGTFWQATQPVSGTFWQATQPVSGTVTAGQGTANTLANKWPVQVTDGTNTMPTGDAATRPVHIELDAQTTTGYTPGTFVAAASNNLTTVKASAGTLGYLSASNNAAYPVYVKVYDGSPTMGTTACIAQWEIPCNATAANGSGRECHLPPQGLKFSTGIYVALTKGQATNDNTSTVAGDGTVTWAYI